MPKKPSSRAALLAVPTESIERRIYLIRGLKVMLDRDLAELYQVPTKVFNQAVKRNKRRFPEDFMFRLTAGEGHILRSQVVTLEGPGAPLEVSSFCVHRAGRGHAGRRAA